jgi:hypothetical protein
MTCDLVYRKFLDLKQDVLRNITASSGPSAFEQIFPTNSDPAFTHERLDLSKTIDHIKGDLQDIYFVPSQDMLELYLFSIHWLMLYDKVRYTYIKQNYDHTNLFLGVSGDISPDVSNIT